MSKKYLSLDEAARMLSLAPEELVRLRERGEVRGFADRGTWKFKHEDVETLLRRRQADSSPELPLAAPELPLSGGKKADMGEQPTVIRRERAADHDHLLSEPESEPVHVDSDSDVRLTGSPDMDLDFNFDIEGDSDVKLTGLKNTNQNNIGTDPEIVINQPGSDSDVRLVRPDSDSDVKLTADSNSDVKLVGDATEMEVSLKPIDNEGGTDHDVTHKKQGQKENSDSDVKLVSSDSAIVGDVSLMDDDDDAIAIDFNPDANRQASVLDEESGVTLGQDSSLLLGESGISLAGPSDSGINLELNDDAGLTLAIDDESGISLDAGESGISLESVDSGISLESAESGISLEGDTRGGTVPMIDIFDDDDGGETHFEMDPLEDDDSGHMLGATGEMDVVDEAASDAIFDLDEDAEEEEDTGAHNFDDEDMDLEADSFEEEGDLDVFDADEGAFEETGTEGFTGAPVGRMRAAETEWSTATFVGLTIGSLLLLVCGVVMIDLVKNTATAATPNPVAGKVLEILGGLYK